MKTLTLPRWQRESAPRRLTVIAVAALALGVASDARAATLHPGDIVVAGRDLNKNGVVFQVDPITGAHTIISDSTHGAGPQMHNIGAVTMASDGQLWVCDVGEQGKLWAGDPTYAAQILKIDPVTGNRVAVPNLGLGAPLMARELGGQLIVVSVFDGIYSLNPGNGSSTRISGGNVGSGPAFDFTGIFAIYANSAFITSASGSIVRVDLTTGARTIVSSANVGTGPVAAPLDVAVDSTGYLIATTNFPGVFRVDPATGNRVAISSPTVGGGVPLIVQSGGFDIPLSLVGLAIGADGAMYTSVFAGAPGSTGILKIDPVTGDRQLLANMSGEVRALYGVTIVPANVPEPATIVLAALGATLLLVRRPKRVVAMCGRTLLTLFAAALVLFVAQNSARAVTLRPGDLVVAAQHGKLDGALFRVDPVTGAYTLIADNTHGSGPQLHNSISVSMASDGQLWVTDYGTQGLINDVPNYQPQILKVDPVTGDRVAVPGPAPTFSSQARELDGRLILSAHGVLYSVDPSNGARTTISGNGVGSGPAFSDGTFSLSGNYAFIADFNNITRVDLTTGARNIVSGATVGSGPVLTNSDVTLNAAGFLIETAIVINGASVLPGVYRVDPATGNRVAISTPTIGGGLLLPTEPIETLSSINLAGVVIGADGAIYAAANLNGLTGILKIDPVTGDRQLLSTMSSAASRVFGVAIVPANVPEPATLVLAAIGCALLLVRPLGRVATLCGRTWLTLFVAAPVLLVSLNSALAVTLRPGDLVISVQQNDFTSTILRIDPATGISTVISDSTHGTGPIIRGVASFVIAPDGQLLVADQGSPEGVLWSDTAGGPTSNGLYPPQMLIIDPATGDRTPLPVPAGALADRDTVIAGQIGNQIIATSTAHSGLTTGIISVDRSTGAATTILPNGSGSNLSMAYYMALRGDQAFVAAPYAGSIVQIDLNTLAQTPITSSPVLNEAPMNLKFDSHGDLIVLTYQAGILRVDPTTGNKSPISNDTIGTGPAYAGSYGYGMAIGANDTIYLLRNSGSGSNASRTILQVDPTTGDRHTVADVTSLGRYLTEIAVVQAPEPATFALAALGVALGAAARYRWSRAAI